MLLFSTSVQRLFNKIEQHEDDAQIVNVAFPASIYDLPRWWKEHSAGKRVDIRTKTTRAIDQYIKNSISDDEVIIASTLILVPLLELIDAWQEAHKDKYSVRQTAILALEQYAIDTITAERSERLSCLDQLSEAHKKLLEERLGPPKKKTSMRSFTFSPFAYLISDENLFYLLLDLLDFGSTLSI